MYHLCFLLALTQRCDSRHKPILLILSFVVHNLDSVNINNTAGITCFYLKANRKVLSALRFINSVWHIFFYYTSYSHETTNVIVMQAEETHLIYEGDISPIWCYITDLFELITYCKRYLGSSFFLLQLRPQFQAQLGLLSSAVLGNQCTFCVWPKQHHIWGFLAWPQGLQFRSHHPWNPEYGLCFSDFMWVTNAFVSVLRLYWLMILTESNYLCH